MIDNLDISEITKLLESISDYALEYTAAMHLANYLHRPETSVMNMLREHSSSLVVTYKGKDKYAKAIRNSVELICTWISDAETCLQYEGYHTVVDLLEGHNHIYVWATLAAQQRNKVRS